MFKKFFFILILSLLSFNALKADVKTSYVDIDYILSNSIAGKSLLEKLKKEEKLKIDKFKISDENFRDKEKKIIAKKNLITNEEINKELKSLQIEFQSYKKNKIQEIKEFKDKRNRNILNFIKMINPIIENYMTENSISILLDKKNIFIASKDYDITKNLITLIDKKIENIDIK
ncbi:OmpH family outer membrane protein [uncultured Candidatus Pelagibacter sp.]|uniref:OmpH family outer membrane protein n=1 Tax=uncultured Candidatus Pelagibacter sp. TaxID=372654 RepID=UPI00262D3BF2|nr:OmpH family outer membrane protein [uncultured Candidatus Pelagibacter sp.]